MLTRAAVTFSVFFFLSCSGASGSDGGTGGSQATGGGSSGTGGSTGTGGGSGGGTGGSAGGSVTCLEADAGGPLPDAGTTDGGDFSCLGQALPTSAVATLHLSGFVTAAGLTRNRVPGALVELFSANNTLLASATSDADGGTYAVETAIACNPLAGSMRASKPDAGFFDAWYYPAEPFRYDRKSLELVVFDAAAQTLVTALAQVTVMPNTAALALGVEDCGGGDVSGATVSSNPAGTVRYVNANGFPSMAEMATTTQGQLLIFNLPPGNVTLTTTVNGMTYRTRTVNARVGAITATTLTP